LFKVVDLIKFLNPQIYNSNLSRGSKIILFWIIEKC